MPYVLSPARTLDDDNPVAPGVAALATTPRFMRRAAGLVELLRVKTPAPVAALGALSDGLAALDVARYAAWPRRNTARYAFDAGASAPGRMVFRRPAA